MKTIVETRSASDPERYVADLNEAGRTMGWGGYRFTAELVEVLPERTPKGRARFVVRITQTDVPVR